MYIPKLNLKDNVKLSILNIFISFIIMFTIYSLFFLYNKNNFKGAEDLVDIWYFTTTTHSTTGYGDILPNTKIMKLIVSIHQMLILFMTLELVIVGFTPV